MADVKLNEQQIQAIEQGVADPRSIDHTPEWRDAYMARFAVVANCAECQEPLIAEEVQAHSLGHVTDRVRPIAAAYHDLTNEEKDELKQYIADW